MFQRLPLVATPAFSRDVRECAVSVVVIQNVLAERGDENIVEAVVVVIADANALSPAVMDQTGFCGDVGEGAVAIIFEKMRNWFLALGKSFEAPAVHQENIQPVVVVVIVESDAAAGCFEQIFVFVFAAEDSFGVEAGFAGDVDEADADIVSVVADIDSNRFKRRAGRLIRMKRTR